MSRPTQREPRDRQLNLSLTVSEWEEIRRRAEALGMRPAHFGRAVLLDIQRVPSTTYRTHAGESNPLTRLIYNALARIGNNLNQIVRHLHQTGDPLPSDLEPLLADIRSLLARVPR